MQSKGEGGGASIRNHVSNGASKETPDQEVSRLSLFVQFVLNVTASARRCAPTHVDTFYAALESITILVSAVLWTFRVPERQSSFSMLTAVQGAVVWGGGHRVACLHVEGLHHLLLCLT